MPASVLFMLVVLVPINPKDVKPKTPVARSTKAAADARNRKLGPNCFRGSEFLGLRLCGLRGRGFGFKCFRFRVPLMASGVGTAAQGFGLQV